MTAFPLRDLTLNDQAFAAACAVERCRAGGPGGQHVNHTASAIRLVHRATGLSAQCQDHRHAERNLVAAIAALRLRLACQVRGADPVWLTPHRRGRLIAVGPTARAYPLVVACLLDALAAARGSPAGAGAALAVSGTQVVRVLAAHKEALAAANALRAGFGQGPLHGR